MTFVLLSRAKDGSLYCLTHGNSSRLAEFDSEEEAEHAIAALDRYDDDDEDDEPFADFQIVKLEI